VPTGIIRGWHGDDIVGQLTGFPFPVGAADVFRVAGHTVKVEHSASRTSSTWPHEKGHIKACIRRSEGVEGVPSSGCPTEHLEPARGGRAMGVSWVRFDVRPVVVAGLAFAAMSIAPASAGASSPAPPRPSLDTVTATGTAGEDSDIDITAQSGPSGENPTGTASFSIDFEGPVTIAGPVTCLRVTGNTAVLNFQSQLTPELGLMTIELTDNGGGGRDVMTLALEHRAAADCSPPGPGETAPLDPGRAIVVDASPDPTLKRQCKHGGWAQLGFANQGQCVRFVRRHPGP
jgi:hypothetical protein